MVTVEEMRDKLDKYISEGYGGFEVYLTTEWSIAHPYHGEYTVDKDDVAYLVRPNADDIIILG